MWPSRRTRTLVALVLTAYAAPASASAAIARLHAGQHPARTLEARELAKLGFAVVPDGTPGSRPDGALRIALAPNDPEYQGSAWPYMLARFTDGWSRTTGSPSTVIAIVDTGVDPATTDLAGALLSGYNFYDGNTDTSDPNATYFNAANALLSELRKRAGIGLLLGGNQPFAH